MLNRRATWKKRRDASGAVTLELRPAPKLRVITYGVVEEACGFLGISPQALFGGEMDVRTLTMPSLDNVEGFFRAVLVNHRAYAGFRRWPIDRLEAAVAVIVANFLTASVPLYRLPGPLGNAFSLN